MTNPSLKFQAGGSRLARTLNDSFHRTPMTATGRIESAKRLLASGDSPKCVAKNLGVSIPTLYRWVPASAHA